MIELSDLIAPCKVIDITSKCGIQNRSYCLSEADIVEFEGTYGMLEEKDIVLVRTGAIVYLKYTTLHINNTFLLYLLLRMGQVLL